MGIRNKPMTLRVASNFHVKQQRLLRCLVDLTFSMDYEIVVICGTAITCPKPRSKRLEKPITFHLEGPPSVDVLLHKSTPSGNWNDNTLVGVFGPLKRHRPLNRIPLDPRSSFVMIVTPRTAN